ncbi:MAG: hypothetical protein FJ027_14795 [Candidatus Rokubacteria bacterium]|nr:hypothetical protein [Candidatus Rokubacteria bacterium]
MRLAGIAVLLALVTLASAAGATLPPDLPAPQRARLDAVAQAAAVSTHVEAEPFVGQPEVFEYLLNHPEFATRVTRVLRVARYRIWRQADGLWLDDGWGAVGRFDIVYAQARTRVMHARGVYSKRLLPDIHGEAVVMIQYDVKPGPNGRSLIAATVTGHVKLDSGLLSGLTKLVTPVARAKAAREAHTLVKVFAKVARAADESPATLCQDLAQQPDVSPRDLAGFCRLLSVR